MFRSRLPHKPYCTDNLSEGLKIRPLEVALRKKYIQINCPALKSFLAFDVDYEGAVFAPSDANLPPPSITVINPANQHAHLIYALAAPVCFSAAGRAAPQKYYRAVEWAYRERLGADKGYSGLIVKNPWSAAWRTIENGSAVYDLAELADYVELPRIIPRRDNAKGRNCTLFDTLRVWAYRAIRGYWRPDGFAIWHETLQTQGSYINDFETPLAGAEVLHVVKSVARWTWRHMTPEGFAEIQRVRRARLTKRQAAVKEKGKELMERGEKASEISKILNVTRQTVYNWIKEYQAERENQEKNRKELSKRRTRRFLEMTKQLRDNLRKVRTVLPPFLRLCKITISDNRFGGRGPGFFKALRIFVARLLKTRDVLRE